MLKQNRYLNLPERFTSKVEATPVRAPRLVKLNAPLAAALGWQFDTAESAEILSGNKVAAGTEPFAMAYAGHQFGHFVPQLGDGRALVIGEVADAAGKLYDVQLKGSGKTVFSRNGDGRAALGPVVREYIMSEAMHALGIPTTRALAFVTTGEPVFRETPQPGAILTRVAASHIRIGTLQYFAAMKDREAVTLLADYCIDRHYPQARMATNPYLGLLESVVHAQAKLIAQWMQVGFIHGVMNTDNMTISGETIDYGPFQFLDAFNPGHVYSAIDRHGRYAFGNQPMIAHWNLTRLAEALLPLLGENEEKAIEAAEEALNQFPNTFTEHWLEGMRRKLGFAQKEEGDEALIGSFLALLQEQQADYTNSFRDLSEMLTGALPVPEAYTPWVTQWQARLAREDASLETIALHMNQHNPAYIPRNHRVEAAIRAAVDQDDFSVMEQLLTVLATPYEDQPEHRAYRHPPQPEERVLQTFCGT